MARKEEVGASFKIPFSGHPANLADIENAQLIEAIPDCYAKVAVQDETREKAVYFHKDNWYTRGNLEMPSTRKEME
jgi:hypothetical protein